MRVYASIVGDLFHFCHMRFLKKIKTLYPSCILIVGIHSDDVVENYKRKPIMSMKERVAAVFESNLADEIIENAPLYESSEYYNKHNIDIVVHGHHQEEHDKYAKFYQDAIKLGIFKRIDYNNDISTSEIIKRIVDRYTDID